MFNTLYKRKDAQIETGYIVLFVLHVVLKSEVAQIQARMIVNFSCTSVSYLKINHMRKYCISHTVTLISNEAHAEMASCRN